MIRSFTATDLLGSLADPRSLVEDVSPIPGANGIDYGNGCGAAVLTDCNGDRWHVNVQRVTGHDTWPSPAG